MRPTKKILVSLLIIFFCIQFIRPAKNHSEQVSFTDLSKAVNVPGKVDVLLKAACYDCHSNNTNYPWYSNVQPLAWFLSNHIRKGKAELNFSEFGSYSLRRQISKLYDIAKNIEKGVMPLQSYTMLHKSARLSKEDKALLIEWATRAKDSLSMKQ